MLALQTIDLTSMLGHGIHYAIVTVGLLGLLALLAPQLSTGRREPQVVGPQDEHARRVAELRSTLSRGSLRTVPPGAPPAPGRTTVPADSRSQAAPPQGSTRSLVLPIAVVSSAAAAGVHAAVGPAHVEEGLLLGAFFAVAALAQLAWAARALVAPSRRLLTVGVLGNGAIVALWTVTRTVGLPLGILPEAEAAGPWDLAAVGWELVAAGACLVLLSRAGPPRPRREIGAWHPAARIWLGASLAVILALPFLGVGEG
ncbi:hypothetical protein [Nocardioides sp.]|uniref:hypothetical protein n=1 Tax=Nocardioides sp. TaxID=35761 RepID=UPI0035639287